MENTNTMIVFFHFWNMAMMYSIAKTVGFISYAIFIKDSIPTSFGLRGCPKPTTINVVFINFRPKRTVRGAMIVGCVFWAKQHLAIFTRLSFKMIWHIMTPYKFLNIIIHKIEIVKVTA